MTNKSFRRWIVSGLLLTGLLPIASGTEPSLKPRAADLASLEAEAAAGDASAQTRLADHYASVADFAKAVAWYGKAAARGELEAQLSLASCYLAGQGVERNPTEAARWLRAAAARLEEGQPAPRVAAAPSPPPFPPPLRSVPEEAATGPTAKPSVNGRSASRIQRVLTVQVVQPELQEPAGPLPLLKATP